MKPVVVSKNIPEPRKGSGISSVFKRLSQKSIWLSKRLIDWKRSLQGWYIPAQGEALGFCEWNRSSSCKPSITHWNKIYCPFRAHGVFVVLNPTRHFVLRWADIYQACSPKALSICKVNKQRVTFWDTLFKHRAFVGDYINLSSG